MLLLIKSYFDAKQCKYFFPIFIRHPVCGKQYQVYFCGNLENHPLLFLSKKLDCLLLFVTIDTGFHPSVLFCWPSHPSKKNFCFYQEIIVEWIDDDKPFHSSSNCSIQEVCLMLKVPSLDLSRLSSSHLRSLHHSISSKHTNNICNVLLVLGWSVYKSGLRINVYGCTVHTK